MPTKAQQPDEPTKAQQPDEPTPLLQGKKILVADDEKETVRLAKIVLEDNGAEIYCAYDGEELWEGLANGNWSSLDLILLDLKMPRMNGVEVCKKLKDDPRFQQIPILVFTAKVGEYDRKEARKAGADDYITKPFIAKNLAPLIRDLINRSKSKTPS
ncbi:MAG: response regulator [Candidatus Hodarchaeota archaeon]